MSGNLAPLSLAASLLAGTALADVPTVAVDIAPVHSMVSRVMESVGEPSLIVGSVMDGSDARTGVMDPLGSDLEPGADLYPQLLRNLATSLANCL